MHYFNRKDALADVAGNLLNKTRNQTLAEALYTKNVQGTPDGRGLFYIEDQDNLQAINNFIKNFTMGMHQHPHDVIAKLLVNLQTVGLVVDNYDGGEGTYDVYQYGKLASDHPVTGDMATDDIIFMRSKKHGKLKIKKSAVPGGLFTVDAELYLLADKPKNREKPIKQPFPEQK
jgi:hypothetical protein